MNRRFAISSKVVSLGDRRYAEKILSKFGEVPDLICWVRKRKVKKDESLKKVDNRLFVISDTRILTVGKRKASLSNRVYHVDNFYNLRALYKNDSTNIVLEFEDWSLDIFTDQVQEILVEIFGKLRVLYNKYPVSERPFVHKGVERNPGDELDKALSSIEKKLDFKTEFFTKLKTWLAYYGFDQQPLLLELLEGELFNRHEKEIKNYVIEYKHDYSAGPANVMNFPVVNHPKTGRRLFSLDFWSNFFKNKTDYSLLRPVFVSLRYTNYFTDYVLSDIDFPSNYLFQFLGESLVGNDVVTSIKIRNLQRQCDFSPLGVTLQRISETSRITEFELSGTEDLAPLPSSKEFWILEVLYFFEKARHLKELNMSRLRLQADSIRVLIDSLLDNEEMSLEHLNLSGNSFGSPGAEELQKYLSNAKRAKTLRVMHLEDCQVSLAETFEPVFSNGAGYIFENWLVLNVSHNKFESKDIDTLLKFLKSTKNLKVLALRNTGLDGDKLATIFEEILLCEGINGLTLDVSENDITESGAKKISKAMSSARKQRKKMNISTLIMDDCKLGKSGIRSIADSLKKWEEGGIEKLSLSRNVLRSEISTKSRAAEREKLFWRSIFKDNLFVHKTLRYLRMRGDEKTYSVGSIPFTLPEDEVASLSMTERALNQIREEESTDEEPSDEMLGPREEKKEESAPTFSLEALDVSGNGLGSDGVRSLLEYINTVCGDAESTIKLLKVHRNGNDIKSLNSLKWFAEHSKSLLFVTWPRSDLRSVINGTKKKARGAVKENVKQFKTEIRQILEKNLLMNYETGDGAKFKLLDEDVEEGFSLGKDLGISDEGAFDSIRMQADPVRRGREAKIFFSTIFQ